MYSKRRWGNVDRRHMRGISLGLILRSSRVQIDEVKVFDIVELRDWMCQANSSMRKAVSRRWDAAEDVISSAIVLIDRDHRISHLYNRGNTSPWGIKRNSTIASFSILPLTGSLRSAFPSSSYPSLAFGWPKSIQDWQRQFASRQSFLCMSLKCWVYINDNWWIFQSTSTSKLGDAVNHYSRKLSIFLLDSSVGALMFSFLSVLNFEPD